jgi:hypothetical protein
VSKLDWAKANRAEMPKVARQKTETQKRQEAVAKAYANGTAREQARIIKVIEDSVGRMTADVIISLIKGDNK